MDFERQTATSADIQGHDAPPPPPTCGQLIRAKRLELKWTVEMLAAMTTRGLESVHAKTITRIEEGKTRPTPRTLALIAKALNLDYKLLLDSLEPRNQHLFQSITLQVVFAGSVDIDGEGREVLTRAVETAFKRAKIPVKEIKTIRKRSVEVTFDLSLDEAVRFAEAYANGELSNLSDEPTLGRYTPRVYSLTFPLLQGDPASPPASTSEQSPASSQDSREEPKSLVISLLERVARALRHLRDDTHSKK